MNEQQLKQDLIRDEGKRLMPYVDSVGKLTGGVGRNLTDRGFSESEVDLMLHNDILRTQILLDRYLPWWRLQSEIRQRVLCNLAFNMGVGPSPEDPTGKLLTFKNTLAAMERGDTEAACEGLRNSKWARQVGVRADRLINQWRDE